GGAESLWERQKREEREVRAQIEQDPFVRSVMEAFPGAEIISIRNTPLPDAASVAEAPDEDED
ncbi:MAG TPA: DNA polymerase III subunit gamma/tau, partial [Phenylobacterium sp.]|nr:DNA polymerase III subunit gamma/tau [Phenylobacterium sp.]